MHARWLAARLADDWVSDLLRKRVLRFLLVPPDADKRVSMAVLRRRKKSPPLHITRLFGVQYAYSRAHCIPEV